MGSERAYPGLGQAILLIAVMLGANVLAGLVLHLAGVSETTNRGATLGLGALIYLFVLC